MHISLPRRRRAAIGLTTVVAIASTLAGCTVGEDTAPPSPGFPITVEHALGKVVIDRKPDRIVTLGAADTQIASALGADIVGAVRNPASEDGNWPTVSPALGSDVAVLDSAAPDLERIAAMKPNLILATSAQPAYVKLYDKLSDIAPVIAYKNAMLQDSGNELTTLIGNALGKESSAAELIATSDTRIREFAASHNYLKGHTYVFGQYASETYLIVGNRAQSVQFMNKLGLVVPADLSRRWNANANDYASSLGMFTPSSEELDILDSADIALISAYGDNAARDFAAFPLVSRSRLAAEKRLSFIGQDLAAPLLQPNPATTEYLLRELAPYLDQLR